MLGCEKCYFVCTQDKTMKEHVKKKHKTATSTENGGVEDEMVAEMAVGGGKRLICDICGYECKSNKVGYLERHKARMHDPVLLDCPHCPARYKFVLEIIKRIRKTDQLFSAKNVIIKFL